MAVAISLSLAPWRSHVRDVRLVDSSPADILRRNNIGVAGETTPDTGEDTLGETISFINTITNWASSAGILGRNKNKGYSCQDCFVFDFPSKVCKAPRGKLSPLALSNRDLVADALQVLKSNATPSAFSLFNKPLSDCVVDTPSETSFFSSSLFKQAPSGFCALSLKPCPKPLMSSAEAVEVPTGVEFSVAVSGYVFDAQIHAKPINRRDFRRFLNFDDDVKEEQISHQTEKAFTTLQFE